MIILFPSIQSININPNKKHSISSSGMTHDIKDGYHVKGRQYDPKERVDVDIDNSVERVSAVNPS